MLRSLAAWIAAAAAILGIGVLAVSLTGSAANVHLKGGPKAQPSFYDHGLTLSSTASIAGLGNEDVVVTLTATGQPTATCTNPAGATQPPGQNPAEVTLTGSESIPKEQVKNGNLTVTVTTDAPQTPIPGAPGCPNPQWTEDITDIAFTSATLVVEQPAGTTVLTVSCTFSPATSDGSVPPKNVTCTSS